MQKIIFGYDLGIASIGWAAIKFDDESFNPDTGEVFEGRILGAGTRCFPVAENPKDGTSLAEPRRMMRLSRRACRRKARRLLGLKQLFVKKGLAESLERIKKIYSQKGKVDVWTLRAEKAFNEELSKDELIRVLIHLAKHRGFKSYRKAVEEQDKEGGKVLSAIKANKALLTDNKTLAQIIVEQAGISGKKRNRAIKDSKGKVKEIIYNNSISRDEIEREVECIFDAQKKYGIFTEELLEDYKNIAFRHRPVGSIADMVGVCRFEKGEKRAPKEAPSSELFVALTKINNLSVIENGNMRQVTDEERKRILEVLKTTKKVTYKTLKSKVFGKDISIKGDTDTKNLIFYEMKGWHQLKSQFDKEQWAELEKDIPLLNKVVEIIACEKNDEKIKEELKKVNISDENIKVFCGYNFSKFIHLSLKAVDKIIPFMMQGDSYDKACEKAGYDFQENVNKLVSKKSKFLEPIPQDQMTTVPVVNRTIAQFRKVYNAMVRRFGVPDQINIETGRDLKKNHDERRKIEQEINQHREERSISADELKNMGMADNAINILKYRLYQEQDGKCIYSGHSIDLNRLDETGYLDVDHIVPYSRSLDNSQTNKVLCLSSENRKKGNKTPYEYFKDLKTMQQWDEFVARVNLLRNYKKKEKLLIENYEERELKFKERNANDNSYIATFVKRYCEEGIDFSLSSRQDIKNRVQVRNGALTDYLRHQWGLQKDRNESDLHHAQDAIVIACATQGMVEKLSRLSSIFENKEKYRERKARELGHEEAEAWYKYIKSTVREPWCNFRNEVLKTLKNIFVSRPPRKKATGSAHKETIYSKRLGKGSLPIRGGMAEKENMFRLDVFKKDNQYYIVPIYVVDLVKKDGFQDAPQPYKYVDGKLVLIDETYQFTFSLFKDDYVEVFTEGEVFKGYINQYSAQTGQLYLGSVDNSTCYKIKTDTFIVDDKILLPNQEHDCVATVKLFDKMKQKMIVACNGKDLELDASLKLNKKGEETKNIQTLIPYIKLAREKKISLPVMQNLKKYQVSPLGDIHEVKQETRLPLSIKKNKGKKANR